MLRYPRVVDVASINPSTIVLIGLCMGKITRIMKNIVTQRHMLQNPTWTYDHPEFTKHRQHRPIVLLNSQSRNLPR